MNKEYQVFGYKYNPETNNVREERIGTYNNLRQAAFVFIDAMHNDFTFDTFQIFEILPDDRISLDKSYGPLRYFELSSRIIPLSNEIHYGSQVYLDYISAVDMLSHTLRKFPASEWKLAAYPLASFVLKSFDKIK
jgi:hypothetical protein